jgi:hypothetical protein
MLKTGYTSLVRMTEKRKQVRTTRQFGSLSQLGISILAGFRAVYINCNLLNAGPCGKIKTVYSASYAKG